MQTPFEGLRVFSVLMLTAPRWALTLPPVYRGGTSRPREVTWFAQDPRAQWAEGL